jgi:hypothetical protein
MATISAASEWRDGRGPAARRAAKARVLCWLTAVSVGLHAVTARAASDWIDELPTVTTVAHAVREQLKVETANWNFAARGIALEDDDDLFAVYLVGTLVLLRKIIAYKLDKEMTKQEEETTKQEEESSSLDRETKLKYMVASYLEAELLIGKEVGNRQGYLTTAQKCRDKDCSRRWFKTGYSNVYISASYRARILSRLFACGGRAAELDRLAQSYALRTPYFPSPAETEQIVPELKGLAPAGCCVYGGDAKGNGLCDDWRNPLPKKPGNDASASACPARAGCARENQPLFLGGQLACDGCDARWMEVRRGVSARQPSTTKPKSTESAFLELENCDGKKQSFSPNPPGLLDDGITIRVKCAKGRLVQFIAREYRLADGSLEKGRYGLSPHPAEPTKLACFDKTDSDKPNWRTDSKKKPNPYYEAGGAYITSCDSMTTIDAPHFVLEPQHKKGRAIAKSFAVCDGKVVSVVNWSREFVAGASCPTYHVDPPRDPTPAEIMELRERSDEEKFDPWP